MDGELISSGIGQGQAQILKPQDDLLGEALKQAQVKAAEKKAESAANKAKALDMLTKMGDFHIWTQRDGEEFKKKQQAVWDGIMGKDLDDPSTMLWLAQQAQDLKFSADKSNEDKNLWTEQTKRIASEGAENFLPNTVDYLFNYADPSNSFKNFDASKIMKKVDIEKDIEDKAAKARAIAQANAQKGVARGTIPGAPGEAYDITTAKEEFTPAQAENIINTSMLEPAYRASMELKWKADPNSSQYKDVDEYARKVYAPRLVVSSTEKSASRITDKTPKVGAGSSKPYGNVVMDVYDETLAPDEVASNPELGQYLLDNPDFKEKYDIYLDSVKKAGAAWPNKDDDGNNIPATAAEFAANMPQKVKLIPISRPNETAPSEMSWKDKNGYVIKGRFKQLVDYNGHLVVNVIEEQKKKDKKTGEQIVEQVSTYVPLNADNFGQINQEFSDKDVPNGVAMQLTDLGYGDQINKFKMQSSTRSKAPASGGPKTSTSNPKRDATGKTAPSNKSDIL